MPKTRLTHAERWLASGHRYDDIQLWQELCTMLETRGLTPTADLPEYLAPLVFRDPENTYLTWLREQLLVPVIHLRGHAREDGNGWRVRRDWRNRLEVMQDATPDALLHWWRTLEPTLRATCLKREENINTLIYDRSVPGTHTRTVTTTTYSCTLCTGSSWNDDPRGILHVWRGNGNRADCPLVRLHLKIREGARQTQPQQSEPPLASELQRLSEHYVSIGETFEGRFWDALAQHNWRDSAESAGVRRPAWAAFHIAQLCGVWIEPTHQDVDAYMRYLRSERAWPFGTGIQGYQKIVVDMYREAADKLEKLGTWFYSAEAQR